MPAPESHSIVCRQAPTRSRRIRGAPQWMMVPSHDHKRSLRVVRITISPVFADTYNSVPPSSFRPKR